MGKAKSSKGPSDKRISTKGKIIRKHGRRFISKNLKKTEIMSANNQERSKNSDEKPTIENKARPKSKNVGNKQKTWVPHFAPKEVNTFSRSKRELRKSTNTIEPKIQMQSSKNMACFIRKCKESQKVVKEKAVLNKQKKKEVSPEKQYAENDGSGLSEDKVMDAVKALLVLLEDNKTQLFSDAGKDIYLQVTSYKVPKTSPREIRVVLPHSVLPDSPDVCLFTSDLQKGRKIDHEPTLEHFKELLSKKGVTSISEVITVRQLKTEFDRFELKRALCNRFDVFLSEAKVCGHITHLLGKTFYVRRKIPVPIKLDAEDLKERVEMALHKSSYHVHNKGTLFTLKVAHTLLTSEQIRENIMTAAISLIKNFPGGWDNILQLMIKGTKSLPVPFYMSTMKDSLVPTPVIKPLRPKAYKKATGEITGVGTVVVKPDGEVTVVKKQKVDKIEREIIKREHEARLKREARKRNRSSTTALAADEVAGSESEDEEIWEGASMKDEEEEEEEEEGTGAQAKHCRLEVDLVEFDRNQSGEMVPNLPDQGNGNGPGINALEAAYLEDWELSQNSISKGKSKKRCK